MMGKRALDLSVAAVGILLTSPLLVTIGVLVWASDFRSPFYVASRIGRGGRPFRMIKFRTMTVGADRSGVDSTAADDARITRVGAFLRRWKLDELPQLFNILTGEMSLVGPRPQVKRDVDIFTDVERRLLDVQPGITDLSSIVFADEGDILKGSPDPDLSYNQIIRPWKSRLGLLYVEHRSVRLDLEIILLTVLTLASKETALVRLQRVLLGLGADPLIRAVARRDEPLTAYPPPGAAAIVSRR